MSTVSSDTAGSARRLWDSLACILPALPPELVSPAAQPWLSSVGSVLPPQHRAGFECRLDAGDDEVDLQQGFAAKDQEPARLARFLERAEPANEAWRSVHRLAQRWSAADNLLHEGIAELWLEVDAPATRAGDALTLSEVSPSVFATLASEDGDAALAIARQFLDTLLGASAAASLDPALLRFARACAPPARISHVGVMLGRTIPSMRVHLSPIPLGELSSSLVEIGWPSDAQPVQSLATTLLDYGDLLVLCLDVVHDQVARLGLECFFAQKQGLDPRWPALLERLVNLGLSSTEKAEALLRWPGYITPAERAGQWPEELIVQSLTRDEGLLGMFERRLSHIKLTCLPDRPATAKAYFGYGNVWTSPRSAADPSHRSRKLRPADTLPEAVEAAVGRLLRARNQGGWWRDFFDHDQPLTAERPLAAYNSDEWVTAYVGAALAEAPGAPARRAAQYALELLFQRRAGSDGWGYHVRVPPDADTTTWVLRLARALGRPVEGRLADGRRLVQSLTDADGGVHTYAEAAARQLAQFTHVDGSYAGWCARHTCVTAAAAVLELAPDPGRYLLNSQRADGAWSGYWWEDDEYTTARAVEALVAHDRGQVNVVRAVNWSAGRIDEDGAVRSARHGGPSPFATAHALRAIRVGATASMGQSALAAAARAERWLLDHQCEDGSWEPSAWLRIPAPAAQDPLSSPDLTVTFLDGSGLFTTASALTALWADAGP